MLEKDPLLKLVGEAADGAEVLDLLSRGVIADVVITDINMPVFGGLELTEQMKEKFPVVKVIVLSALDHENIILKALKLGASGYLLKNCSPDELIFAIKHIHEHTQYICEEITSRLIRRMLSVPEIAEIREDINVDFTKRDIEILNLIAEGFTNQEIADKLFTSKRTVENHRQQLIDKTGSRNTVALIRFVMLNGII